MWTTIGHAWAVSHLRVAVETGRLSHTYLITGPQRVGKTHLALEFAMALGCANVERPCGECHSCQGIRAHNHPDLTFVEPDEGRVKIDQVRDLQRDLSLSPYESEWRVCIVTGFETATTEAANALLKTLEEPPPRVILMLIATDANLLLPTIVSRCQVLALRTVPSSEIESALVSRWPVGEEQARLIARVADGRPGWAVAAMEDDRYLVQRRERIELLLELLSEGKARRIMAAEGLAKKKDLRETITTWQSWWRDVVLVQGGCADLVVNADVAQSVQGMAQATDLMQASQAAQATQRLMAQLDRNVNARLALEVPLISWPRLAIQG